MGFVRLFARWLLFFVGVGGDERIFGAGGDNLDLDMRGASKEEALANGEGT